MYLYIATKLYNECDICINYVQHEMAIFFNEGKEKHEN